MGGKYIKKDEDGKEYLYEEMGLGGILFGDRKIEEVKETGFFETGNAKVKSGASKQRQNRPDFLPLFLPSWISGYMATTP